MALLLFSCSNKSFNQTDQVTELKEKAELQLEEGEILLEGNIWSSKNLEVVTFRNGDPIKQAHSPEEWVEGLENKTPLWSYLYFYPTDKFGYGKIYNYWVIDDPRDLAPQGWRIPTKKEWSSLNKMGSPNKSVSAQLKAPGWEPVEQGWSKDWKEDIDPGNNETGFSALGAGSIEGNGFTLAHRYYESWWSSTKDRYKGTDYYHYASLNHHRSELEFSRGWDDSGFYVRLIKE